MIVTTAQLYKVAYEKFAVGAYNINNMEQLLGLFRGNVQSRALYRSTRTSSRTKTKNSARQANWRRCGRA